MCCVFSEVWLEGTPDSQAVNSWNFYKSSIYNRFSETVLFWLCEISPYTGSDWYQPKHSTGTICTYLGFFPFVAPSFLGQSQLPWSWFLGPHFSVSHFPSLVIVWELPAEWEPSKCSPHLSSLSVEIQLCIACCPRCENSCFLYLVRFSSCFHDIVPNWPTVSWQKVKFSWHMFLRHLVINYSNRRQGSDLALTLQNCCFVFTVSCLFFICLFLWK